MSAPTAPAPDFSLVDGAQRTLGLKPVRGFGLGRRILLAVSLTWVRSSRGRWRTGSS